MIVKYFVPLDRFVLRSPLPVDELQERLQSATQSIAWQQFSMPHMLMMLVALGAAQALTGLDFNEPMVFMPAAALWLLFVVTFHVSSSRQRNALAALAAINE